MTDEARLQRWMETHRDGGGHPSAAHVDIDTLIRHATGQLSPNAARMVNEHLQICEDGRCSEFIRSHQQNPEAESDWIQTSEARSVDDARPRTFRSREIIWSTFESMSRELELPIDELVNEAMAAYAQSRGYTLPEQSSPRPAAGRVFDETARDPSSAHGRAYAPPSQDVDDLALTAARPQLPRPPPSRPVTPSSARPSRPLEQVPTLDRPMMPGPPGPPPLRSPPSRPGPPPPPSSRGAPPLPPPSRAPMPPMPMTQRMPDSPRGVTPTPVSTRQLVLEYRGGHYPVEKERFLIGRSKTQADLRLDDPNVSRQHAVIERVGAAWYIVDLGSTNGIHVAGERVARRALTDADVIVITTHEIRCSLR